MPRWQVHHDYLSNRDGRQYGYWPAGQVVDLSEDEAEWCNRDSPGLLIREKPAKAESTSEPDVVDAGDADTEVEVEVEAAPARKRQPARNRQHRPTHDRTG